MKKISKFVLLALMLLCLFTASNAEATSSNSNSIQFEMGSIRANGENAENNSRARTKYLMWCEKGTYFYSPNDLAIVKYADKVGSVIDDIYWVQEYTLDEDCYVRIVVNHVSSADEAYDAFHMESTFLPSTSGQLEPLVKVIGDYTGIPVLNPNDFELGAIKIDSYGWSYSDSLTRIRTKENVTYPLSAGTVINCADGYRCYIGYRLADGSYGKISWFTGDVMVPADAEYVFLVTLDPETKSGFLVDRISEALSFRRSNSENQFPNYWIPEILETEQCIKNNRLNASGKLIEFSFITDPHWHTSAKHSPAIMKKINSDMNVPFIIMGGDIINAYEPTLEGWSNTLHDFYKTWNEQIIFSTIGNHDTNGNKNPDPNKVASPAQLYNHIIRNSEWIGQVGDESVSYIDNTAQKVRYIQFAYWLQEIDSTILDRVDAAIEELPADWNVVLVSHAMFSGAKTGNPLTVSARSDSIAEHFLSLQQREGKANIICWLSGHTHRDYSLTYSDGNKTLLIIATGCDTLGNSSQWGGWEMTAGTITEHCWDYFQIDPLARKIYCTRVGAGLDREFMF